MSEPLYEVMGGQGHMRIACDLTFAEAEQVRRDFDRECFKCGLMNPLTLIHEQPFRYYEEPR